jgi:membrane-associated phospholipid phosphatase
MSVMSSRVARGAFALASATLLGACQEPLSLEPPIAWPNVTPVTNGGGATVEWNKVAQDLVKKYGTSAPATIRMFSLLTVAQYNAIVTAEQDKERNVHPHDGGAIAGASATVLSYIYPNEAAALELLVDQQDAPPDMPGAAHENFAAGEAIGRTVAAAIVERAKTDRFFEPFTGTVPQCPSCWLATPTPPAFATLGQAKPFFLARNDQFRPAPPPAFGSPAFLAAAAEVRQVADTRTAQQDSIAKFWALPAGTVSAQGYWNVIGVDLAVRYHLGERETARTLALMNMAAFDGLIASHEAKYHYWLIRPSQLDPGIVRAIGLPSFPSYPSNHSMLSAASAEVLAAAFPSERGWLEAKAAEGAISRLYGGIHYRFDTEAGLALGRDVARWVMANDVTGHQPFVLK